MNDLRSRKCSQRRKLSSQATRGTRSRFYPSSEITTAMRSDVTTRTCRTCPRVLYSLLFVLALTREHPPLEPWGRQLASTSSNALLSDQSIPVPAEPRRRRASVQVALIEIDRCWTVRRATRRSRGVRSIARALHRSRSTPAGNGLGIIRGGGRGTLMGHRSADRERRERHPNPGRVPYYNNSHFFSLSLDERPRRAADLPQRPLARWICIRPSFACAAPSPLHPPPFPPFALSTDLLPGLPFLSFSPSLSFSHSITLFRFTLSGSLAVCGQHRRTLSSGSMIVISSHPSLLSTSYLPSRLLLQHSSTNIPSSVRLALSRAKDSSGRITSRTTESVTARTRGDRGVTARNSLEADNSLTGAGAASFAEGKSIFPSAAMLRFYVVWSSSWD